MMKKVIGVQNYFDQRGGLKNEVNLTGGKIRTLNFDNDFQCGKCLDLVVRIPFHFGNEKCYNRSRGGKWSRCSWVN